MKRVIALLSFLSLASLSLAQNKILVAAASDLKFALDSIVSRFEELDKGRLEVVYGSSGKLTEQILSGAPFDLFFSADVSYPEILVAKKKAASSINYYAEGHLVVWSQKIDPSVRGMQTLMQTTIAKVAIANPQHAPYGKRAVESLRYHGIYDMVSGKLVYGGNVSQAAQFVSTGAADIGIIALSMARSPAMKREGMYYLVPKESYQPLIQGAIVTAVGKDKPLAHEFFEFVKGDLAVGILKHFGFEKP